MTDTTTLERTDQSATTILEHWVRGAAWAGESERTGSVFNPALGTVQKQVRFASKADVGAAVDVASEAWAGWRDSSIAKRQGVMFAFRELLNQRKGELAEILTAEHGKVLSDALGEIARGMEVVEFACGLGHLTKGAYSENVSTGIDVYTLRQPLGVVGIISPFNFPAMVPLWFFSVALAAATWARSSPGSTATRSRPTSTSPHPTAPRWSSTAATSRSTATPTASGSAPR